MKNKIILVAMTLFIFIPMNAFAETIRTPEPYDYTKGFFDNEFFLQNMRETGNFSLPPEVYDNDLGKGAGFKTYGGLTLEFDIPVFIEAMYLNTNVYESGQTYYLKINFMNGQENIISFYKDYSGYLDLNFENVVKIQILSTDRVSVRELDFFGWFDTDYQADEPQPEVENISNLTFTATSNSIYFDYDLPNDNISHVKIISDGKTYETTKNSFTLDNLTENTEYEITFITVDTDGNESPGITVVVKTLEKIIEDVKEVKVQAKHNRVDLSWQLPQLDDFHYVKIYRKTIEELKEPSNFSLFTKKVFASEIEQGFEPFFETNGTYFNDLTVKPRSEYAYKLKTVTTDEKESPGVIVTAETPDEPEPEIVGGNYTETENGDFLYTWTEPTSGEVKIIVGGEEYATVPASQKEILIPAEDMKYIFGKPDVSLVPISEYGKKGKEFNPTNPLKNIDIGFNASDLLKSGVSLLAVIGPIVLLALSFVFLPRMIKVIKKANAKR